MHVVLFHVTLEVGGSKFATLPAPVAHFLGCGPAAVSFFFVLSGFILAYTYCQPDGSLRGTRGRFWWARFARIYPLYFLSFVLDVPRALSYFSENASSHSAALAKAAISGIGYVGLMQSWIPRITDIWNTPGWSLSTEAFFYATFPFVLVATRSWSLRRLLAVALAGWAVVVASSLVVAAVRPELAEDYFFKIAWRSFPLLRLPEFALGIAVGRAFNGDLSPEFDRWLGGLSVGACILLAGIFLFDTRLPSILVRNALGAPFFAIIILGIARGRLGVFGWLRSEPWVTLGRSSYAVYILHEPLKTWFVWIASACGVTASPALLVAYVVALQLFCLAAFKLVEDPVRRLLTGRFAPAILSPTR